MKENAVQQAVRLEAARLGWYLWRNNVGAAKTDTGSFIRFGIANDSAALNAILKSSDLIGLDHTGKFCAVECKHEGWVFNGHDQRERAQMAFILLVRSRGGRAGFVSNALQLKDLPTQ